jgi:hypothetical protein
LREYNQGWGLGPENHGKTGLPQESQGKYIIIYLRLDYVNNGKQEENKIKCKEEKE